jgi:tetrahydromethanopterin S-methyltransferase subunit G
MDNSEREVANAKRRLEEIQNKVVTTMKEVLVAKQERAEAES